MSEDEGTERLLCQAYCVVYKLEEKDWKGMHKGWAQVNLFEDTEDHTFRVVGWTLPSDAQSADEHVILINSNVTNNCNYSKKSEDFLKYVDEDKITFGFGFYKKENAAENPSKFYDDLTGLIDRLKEEFGGEDDEASLLAFNSRTAVEGSNTVKFVEPAKAESAAGIMAVQAPTNKKASGGSQASITEAKDVKHLAHVKFDPLTRSYQGLPKEWEGLINQQFGLEIGRIECVRTTPAYKSRIPSVLVQMLDYLRKENAFDLEGIFRVAADSEEMSFVKNSINQNTFKKCEDIHCIATLIKVWFRDLPRPILDCVSHYSIVECKTPQQAGDILEKMPEPEGSVMLWLVDMALECTLKSDVNKMTPKNLGIVIGPNLFRPNMVDPMASLQYSQNVAVFLQKGIVWRGRSLGHDIKDSDAPTSNAIQKTF